MNGKTAAVLLSGLLVACTQPPAATAPPAPSPPPVAAAAPTPTAAPAQVQETKPVRADHRVNIQGALCQDLLRLSPEDRAAASMFYIGYQASRVRARTINVSVIPSIEEQALIYCRESPNRPVAQVFADAYSREPGK